MKYSPVSITGAVFAFCFLLLAALFVSAPESRTGISNISLSGTCKFQSLDLLGNAKSATRLNPGLNLIHSRTLGRPVQMLSVFRLQSLPVSLICLFTAVLAFLNRCRFCACRVSTHTYLFQSILRNSLPVRAGPATA